MISKFSNAQSFKWLQTYGLNNRYVITTLVSGSNKNTAVYLVGISEQNTLDTITYGKIKIPIKDRTKPYHLVEVDTADKVIRAKLVTDNVGGIIAIQHDASDNLYLVGAVDGFDREVFNKKINVKNGSGWVAKLDTAWNLQWLTQMGGDTLLLYPTLNISKTNKVYFTQPAVKDTKVGDSTYRIGKYLSSVFGEIDSKNGKPIWSKVFYKNDTHLRYLVIFNIFSFDNKLYINGRFDSYFSSKVKNTFFANSDSFYSPSSFIIKCDSFGNYQKKVDFITPRSPYSLVWKMAADDEFLYFGGTINDSFKFEDSVYRIKEDAKGTVLPTSNFIVGSLTKDFKKRWFFQPAIYKNTNTSNRNNFIYDLYVKNGFLFAGATYAQPISINNQIYKGNSGPGYFPLFFKMDYLGNVLWATNGAKDGNAKSGIVTDISGTDKSIYACGGFYDSIRFDTLFAKAKNKEENGWITRIADYGIFRGSISKGPYCAGDTIIVPFKEAGDFGKSNYFIAQLSDEHGEFEKDFVELGRIKSQNSDTVIGVIPWTKIASSKNYRIRIISTDPVVQSYYVRDSLRLLIYSRDKANPGPTESICYNDSIVLNTYGGTKWTWSPNYNMVDSTKRQTKAWPKVTTTYKIIIGDSSGCGAPDTAFKTIIVRKPLKVVLEFNDTSTCGILDLNVPYYFTGGDSVNYNFQWYFISSLKSWFPLKMGYGKLRDTLIYNAIDPLEKLAIILKDGCTNKPDTAYLTISQRQKVNIKSSFKDTSICFGHKLKYKASVTGGVTKYIKYQWKDIITNSTLSNADSLAFTTSKTEKIQLIVNDGCEALGDTATFNVTVKPPLKSRTNLRDTTVCAGQIINYTAQATGGDDKNYSYSWVLDGKQISTSNILNLKSDILNLNSNLTLITKDNCSVPNDSISKSITVKPAPFANFTYDLACSRTPTNFTFTGTKPKSPITTTFNWDFNKESTSTLEHPSLLFSAAGIKRVKLTALASNGCVDTLTQDINVKPQSQADFTVDDVCESDSAIFINKSKDATGYNWKFGDGNNSNKEAPKHKYQIPSTTTFNVTLVAIVKDGCSDSISKPLTINESPSSDFSITKINQNVDLKANKNGLSTYKWVRIWKDGSKDSTTKTNHVHNYTYHEDIKTICLTAIDNLGCQSQTCKDPSTASGKSINAHKIKIYPNPASETITVEIPSDNQEYTIQLINSLGQVVMQQTAIQHSTFNIQHLSEGVYLVRIKNGEKVWNQRVIIARN